MAEPKSSPDRKRALRPTSSLPSTAETQAGKHGLPADHAARMLEVGMRARQNLARGHQRPFQPHASAPILDFSSSSISSAPASSAFPALPSYHAFHAGGVGAGAGAYASASEITAHARGVLDSSAFRARELQPYGSRGSGLDDNGLGPLSAGGAAGGGAGAGAGAASGSGVRARTKRREAERDADGEDDATDTEDDADADADGPRLAPGQGSVDHAFPPVFKTPALTEPKLFAAPVPTPAPAHAPAHAHAPVPGRAVRALPGRALGKAVSMPVGGLWGGAPGAGAGMDVDDGDGGDGFDVAEWAKSEDF
ncbi:hypothetical protein Q5752_004539 [Cryptotrichosporon argae]